MKIIDWILKRTLSDQLRTQIQEKSSGFINTDETKAYLQKMMYEKARKQLNEFREASQIVVLVVDSIEPDLNATLLDKTMFGYDIRGLEDGPPLWVFRLDNTTCTLQQILPETPPS